MCSATLDVPLLSAYALPLLICLASGAVVTAMLLAPAGGRAAIRSKRVVLGGVLSLIVAVTFGLIYQARTTNLAVDDGRLVASSMFVSWDAPVSSIAWQSAADASTVRLPRRQLGTSTGGVQLGRFVMQDGKEVFAMRTNRPSVLVPVAGETDLILDRTLYDRIRACTSTLSAQSSTESIANGH